MPTLPPKPCRKTGCPALVWDGSGFCDEHKKEARSRYDQRRLTAAKRGYDYRWQRIRAAKLRADPLCERCKANGKLTMADMVHHKDGDATNNDPANHESLCWPCHGEVTSEQIRSRS